MSPVFDPWVYRTYAQGSKTGRKGQIIDTTARRVCLVSKVFSLKLSFTKQAAVVDVVVVLIVVNVFSQFVYFFVVRVFVRV